MNLLLDLNNKLADFTFHFSRWDDSDFPMRSYKLWLWWVQSQSRRWRAKKKSRNHKHMVTLTYSAPSLPQHLPPNLAKQAQAMFSCLIGLL